MIVSWTTGIVLHLIHTRHHLQYIKLDTLCPSLLNDYILYCNQCTGGYLRKQWYVVAARVWKPKNKPPHLYIPAVWKVYNSYIIQLFDSFVSIVLCPMLIRLLVPTVLVMIWLQSAERTWWRLFNRRVVCTKLDIYICIVM
jgi:hypothetical protein